MGFSFQMPSTNRSRVVELQMQSDPRIYNRIAIEIVQVFYLADMLEALSDRTPDHPLVALFRPVIEENLETLEKHASQYYNQIKGFDLAGPSKGKLLDVFINWLEQRFKDLGKMKIENMLLGQLPDRRETQSGNDLIAIGLQEGRQEGERAGLIWLLEAKFGVLDAVTRDRIEGIDSVDRLRDLYRQVLNVDSILKLQW